MFLISILYFICIYLIVLLLEVARSMDTMDIMRPRTCSASMCKTIPNDFISTEQYYYFLNKIIIVKLSFKLFKN